MKSVLLAYNKLSSSNIETIFKEIERSHREHPKETEKALVDIVSRTEIKSNILAVASIIKLAHAVLSTTIAQEIVARVRSLPLFCYLYNYGVLDASFMHREVAELIRKRDYLGVLQVLQMCSGIMDKETLKEIRKGAELEIRKNPEFVSENSSELANRGSAEIASGNSREISNRNSTDPTNRSSAEILGGKGRSFLMMFILESVDQVLAGKSPFRDVLREETEVVGEALDEIVKTATHRPVAVISQIENGKSDAALKFGMNTALKRRVFEILTESQGYRDAQGALYKEGLKVRQFEEVFYLLVYLCSAESKYNEYYADLSVSLLTTCSKNHRGPFNKYLYRAIERHVQNVEKLSVKEIYNIATFIHYHYVEELIGIGCVTQLEYFAKKEIVFARVFFKQLIETYSKTGKLRVKRVKETESMKRVFKNDLVDGRYIKKESEESLKEIYKMITKC